MNTKFLNIVICILLIVLIAVVMVALDEQIMKPTEEYSYGLVLEKVYAPSQSSVSVGPVVGGEGGVAILSTSSEEKWVLIVMRHQDQGPGEIIVVETTPAVYADVTDLETYVELRLYKGYLGLSEEWRVYICC